MKIQLKYNWLHHQKAQVLNLEDREALHLIRLGIARCIDNIPPMRNCNGISGTSENNKTNS